MIPTGAPLGSFSSLAPSPAPPGLHAPGARHAPAFGDQAHGLRVRRGVRPATSTTPPPPPPRRRVRQPGDPLRIAVTSGKGGVGKSQVSASLAVGFAQRGRRTLLVDADLGLASLDLLLGVRPSRDLLEVVRGRATLDELLVPTPAGPVLVPACPGRYEMANLGAAERAALLAAFDQLARRFDVVIFDTGAGIHGSSVDFASAADEVLLVVTPDPSSLRDAYAMAKVLRGRAGFERVHVVANQVANAREGGAVFDRLDALVRRFLELRLVFAGPVPRDASVVEANRSGAPVVLRAPRSPAASALEALCHRLDAEASRAPC